jgi:hypothetical protein
MPFHPRFLKAYSTAQVYTVSVVAVYVTVGVASVVVAGVAPAQTQAL